MRLVAEEETFLLALRLHIVLQVQRLQSLGAARRVDSGEDFLSLARSVARTHERQHRRV